MSVAKAYAEIDAHMAEGAQRTAELGRPVTCRGAGCFGCCKEPVQIERREAEHIAKAVAALPVQDQVWVRDKTRAWGHVFFDGGYEMGDEAAPDDPGRFAALQRYLSANLWCPLLRDGKCLIYADRPASCRRHAAVADPARCHDAALRPSQVYLLMHDSPEAAAHALLTMAEGKNRIIFKFDHLGVWLGRHLLGDHRRSGDAVAYEISSTTPP